MSSSAPRAVPLALLATVGALRAQIELPLLPPAPPPSPTAIDRVVLLCGVVDRGGRLALDHVGLGDGGVAAAPAPPVAGAAGRFRTSGGVLVRTLPEGVKLDFPSGGELLVDPRGRIHERGGEQTFPHPNGLRLHLLDGAVVDVLPQNGSDLPLREVTVHDGREDVVLWRAGRVASRNERGNAYHGRELYVLGDGRSVYELAPIGPMVVFDRVLAPRPVQRELPARAVVVVGDVLARSLVEVSGIAEQRAAGDPRTQQVARALGAIAPRMFQPGHTYLRPDGARGDLVIPTDLGYHFRIEVRGTGPIVLALHVDGDPVPLCEWTTTNTTRLHLVQREAGEGGRPRYLMRGHELRHLLDPLLGVDVPATARSRARRMLVELGAGTSQG